MNYGLTEFSYVGIGLDVTDKSGVGVGGWFFRVGLDVAIQHAQKPRFSSAVRCRNSFTLTTSNTKNLQKAA
jgi:hypothetical protein